MPKHTLVLAIFSTWSCNLGTVFFQSGKLERKDSKAACNSIKIDFLNFHYHRAWTVVKANWFCRIFYRLRVVLAPFHPFCCRYIGKGVSSGGICVCVGGGCSTPHTLIWNLSVFWQNVSVKFPDPILSVNFEYFIIKNEMQNSINIQCHRNQTFELLQICTDD